MTGNGSEITAEPASMPVASREHRPHRILVVDDEPLWRAINTTMLVDAGYAVDNVKDGSLAWDSLQYETYDLVVTDNNMPKMSGLELIKKVRAAGLALPVIMATGMAPEEDFAQHPRLRPAATLIKPYTISELLATVRNVLCANVAMVIWLLSLSSVSNAQELLQPPSGSQISSSESADRPTAMTLSVHGKCDYSEDGVTFTKLERTDVLDQGAIVRTGKNARADLFFRRTGTAIRLQGGTEIKLEQMVVSIKDGIPVVHTLLDLQKGRIFAVVRSSVAGSSLEIRNAAGRSFVEGSGVGRYIITANGTQVSTEGSAIPIKVVGGNGITIVAAGQQFNGKDGKRLSASASSWVKELIELDELDASTEKISKEKSSPGT
jgi:DNA-binding response OmpR family regulator